MKILLANFKSFRVPTMYFQTVMTGWILSVYHQTASLVMIQSQVMQIQDKFRRTGRKKSAFDRKLSFKKTKLVMKYTG